MKLSSNWATLVAAAMVVGFGATPVQAQGPAATPAVAGAPRIAVLDLNYIFKSHERFKAAKDDLQHDVVQAEEELKQKRDEIRRMAEQLEQYKPGSPEYKQLEATLAGRQAQISADVQLKKKEFMQQEAKIYFQAYQEVLDEVRYYASRQQISMVLRINDEAVDPNDPQAVLDELKKSVLFHDANINITAVILDAVNRRGATPQQVGARGAAPPQRGAPGPAAPANAAPRTARPPQAPGQPVPR